MGSFIFYSLLAFMVVLLFLFGASIFSFLNVVIYRVPLHLSFVKGRSFCPQCHQTLQPIHMIPLFSYLFLRGKCAYCHSRISPRYMIVEAIGGLLFLFTCWHSHLFTKYSILTLLQILVVFAFLSVLCVIAFVDADTQEIPNGFVLALLIVSLLSIFVFPQISWLSRLIGFFSSSLVLLLITLFVPNAFGYGDIRLMAAAGVFLGWKLCLLSLFLAVLGGGSYGIYLLLSKKKGAKEHFAFAPFLCGAMVLAWFAGNPILDWYLSLLF